MTQAVLLLRLRFATSAAVECACTSSVTLASADSDVTRFDLVFEHKLKQSTHHTVCTAHTTPKSGVFCPGRVQKGTFPGSEDNTLKACRAARLSVLHLIQDAMAKY